MRFALLAVIVVGCGGKPHPAPIDWPRPDQPRRYVPASEGAPAGPRLRLVGVEGFAWPLAGPPSIEPHHRVTSPWYASCERRGRLHDDELAYVEAWCRYRADPSIDLVALLAPLARTQLPRLAEVIRRDLANHLADTQTAAQAVETLGRHGLALQAHLAAVYIELDRLDDAEHISLGLAKWAPRGSCARDLALLRFGTDVDDFPVILARHAQSPCEPELRRIICAIEEGSLLAGVARDPAVSCVGVVVDDTLAVARAYAAWYRLPQARGAHRLLEVADLALAALAVPDAEELALRAIEAAALVTVGPCTPDIAKRVHALAASPRAQDRFADRRARLVARCPE